MTSDIARPSLRARDLRHQAGAREHLAALRGARPSRAQRSRSLHVAGTNGKGSVTAMAHAALRAAGHPRRRATPRRTCAISPSGSSSTIVRSTPRCSSRRSTTCSTCADRLRAAGALPVHADVLRSDDGRSASSCSAAPASRSAVIEVGLGGRFDATNVISPVAGAITTIDFDHQQHLGDTLERDRVREGRHHQAGHDGGDGRPAARGRATSSRAVRRRARRAHSSKPRATPAVTAQMRRRPRPAHDRRRRQAATGR